MGKRYPHLGIRHHLTHDLTKTRSALRNVLALNVNIVFGYGDVFELKCTIVLPCVNSNVVPDRPGLSSGLNIKMRLEHLWRRIALNEHDSPAAPKLSLYEQTLDNDFG
jgi:hypothetical protein